MKIPSRIFWKACGALRDSWQGYFKQTILENNSADFNEGLVFGRSRRVGPRQNRIDWLSL